LIPANAYEHSTGKGGEVNDIGIKNRGDG